MQKSIVKFSIETQKYFEKPTDARGELEYRANKKRNLLLTYLFPDFNFYSNSLGSKLPKSIPLKIFLIPELSLSLNKSRSVVLGSEYFVAELLVTISQMFSIYLGSNCGDFLISGGSEPTKDEVAKMA